MFMQDATQNSVAFRPMASQQGRGLLQSLERKLIVALLGLGIVPLVIMAGLSYFRTRTVVRHTVESEVRSVTILTEDRVSRWMASREADAKTYASLQFA